MTERKPAELFDPRSFCREELAARGLAEADLPIGARLWLQGTHALSGFAAGQLATAFGTSAGYWLGLERAWQGRTR
jgi:plasmid maintenance system antidote protein VapI